MKLPTLILLVALPMSVFAAQAMYNPTQLQQFETTGSCPNCDLTSTDLGPQTGVQPPYNLAGANLSGSKINIVNGSGSNFSGVLADNTDFAWDSNVGATFSGSSFENASLVEANLSGLNLTKANFTGADVAGANFDNADLSGAIGLTPSEINAANPCGGITPTNDIEPACS